MWQTIDSAPTDGTPVRTVSNPEKIGSAMYAITSRLILGKWHANFGTKEREEWKPYEPQPTHWKPINT